MKHFGISTATTKDIDIIKTKSTPTGCFYFAFSRGTAALRQGTVLTVPIAFPWGKVAFLRFTAEKTDEGLFNTTPFLLKKETGLCLKEKSNPCSLLPQTLSPYQRGQNAPPEERRFPIPTVAARGRQRFPFQINRSVVTAIYSRERP
jgi:hypothetical protein